MIMVDLESKDLVHPEREREMRNGVQTTLVYSGLRLASLLCWE